MSKHRYKYKSLYCEHPTPEVLTSGKIEVCKEKFPGISAKIAYSIAQNFPRLFPRLSTSELPPSINNMNDIDRYGIHGYSVNQSNQIQKSHISEICMKPVWPHAALFIICKRLLRTKVLKIDNNNHKNDGKIAHFPPNPTRQGRSADMSSE